MLRTLYLGIIAACRAVAAARTTREILNAGLHGAAALLATHQALSVVGASPLSQSAVLTSITLGGLIGAALTLGSLKSPAPAVLSGALAAVLLGSPWLPALWVSLLNLPGATRIDQPSWNAAVVFLAALPLAACPAGLAAYACLHASRSAPSWGLIGSGVALGLSVSLVVAASLGVDLLAVLLATVFGVTALRQGLRAATAQESAPPSGLENPTYANAVLALILGAMSSLVFRVACQWSVVSVPALWLNAAVVAVGLGLGAAWAPRRSALLASTVVAACLAIGCVAWSPALTGTSLWLNASVSQPSLLLAGRACLAAIGLLPVAVALGVCCAPSAGKPWHLVSCGGLALAGGLMGWWSVPNLGQAGTPVPRLLLAVAWTAVAVATAVTFLSRGRPAGEILNGLLTWRGSRMLAAGILTVLIVSSLFVGEYSPGDAAKTLFTTRVFMAYRGGTSASLLPYLDDARLLRTRETDRGTLTVWKYGGHQVHVRENGIPRGIVSRNLSVSPQFSADVLQAVFPLVLHEKPQAVLVLGCGTGANLATALEFPLMRCVCAEGDPALLALVRDLHGTGTFDDDRLAVWPVDAPAALRGSPEQFDVIVSNPGQLALASAQPLLTRRFYRSAAARLNADGIFCQWLQCIDLGPEPVRIAVETFHQAFPHVMAVEIAHREFLLLGTSSRKGLVRPDLFDRVQTAQVRRTLANIDLDWSVLLDLPAYRTEELGTFIAASESSLPRSAGRLPFAVPLEVMRWAPKQEELQVALTKQGGRLLNWLGDKAESPLLLRRLGEIAGQQKLKTSLADQYWAYRQSLREQVSNRPASLIQQVGAEGLHPEDKRRLNYFKVLARAVKTRDPQDIQNLLAFAEPYDPLLSDFVHFEAAELYAKGTPRDTRSELEHRLHCVFFASPMDTTVASVIATLKLLREHPECEPDALERWDLTNALLHALQTRWEARAGTPPRQNARTILRDIDATLAAAEKTMALMPPLTADAGLPPETWTARRKVLEISLLAPVQAYRAQVQKHHREVEVVD